MSHHPSHGHRFHHLPVRAWLRPGAGYILAALLLGGCGGDATRKPTVEPADRIPPGRPIEPGSRAVPDGVHHRLEAGQNLYRLSRLYDVGLDDLMAANRITDPTSIPAGTAIFVPGATRILPYPDAGQSRLAWPLRGPITSRYGQARRGNSRHFGIDIDGDEGDTIRAAAGGNVIKATRDGSYGRYVVVDHGDGLRTLYAHASRLLVSRGQRVAAGEPLALVGRSGNARGSHLHFEVLRGGAPIDPLPLLRGDSPRTTSGR